MRINTKFSFLRVSVGLCHRLQAGENWTWSRPFPPVISRNPAMGPVPDPSPVFHLSFEPEERSQRLSRGLGWQKTPAKTTDTAGHLGSPLVTSTTGPFSPAFRLTSANTTTIVGLILRDVLFLPAFRIGANQQVHWCRHKLPQCFQIVDVHSH